MSTAATALVEKLLAQKAAIGRAIEARNEAHDRHRAAKHAVERLEGDLSEELAAAVAAGTLVVGRGYRVSNVLAKVETIPHAKPARYRLVTIVEPEADEPG